MLTDTLVADKKYSVEEYFELEKTSEIRHEFINGELIAMPGESKKANKIARKIVRLLEDKINSKVFDIVNTLASYLIQVDILDAMVPTNTALPCSAKLMEHLSTDILYDAIILAVKHDSFKLLPLTQLKAISVSGDLNLFDAKAFYEQTEAIKICKHYWRL